MVAISAIRLRFRSRKRTQGTEVKASQYVALFARTPQKMWRKRVGVEPTIRPAKDRIAGFEGRGSHQTPFASAGSITGEENGLRVAANSEHLVRFLSRFERALKHRQGDLAGRLPLRREWLPPRRVGCGSARQLNRKGLGWCRPRSKDAKRVHRSFRREEAGGRGPCEEREAQRNRLAGLRQSEG